MKILIPCEYSGRCRDAFIAKGHDVISCDFEETEIPGPHYKGDVYDILFSEHWDMIIAFPDCTAMTVAGNRHYGAGMPKYAERLKALKWTAKFWNDCKKAADRVCFEQPVSVLASMASLPYPFYVHPYEFGHPEQKATGLYLHNLYPLTPTDNIYEYMMTLPKKERERVFYMSPGPDRWKERSRSFQGIMDAMADQWNGEECLYSSDQADLFG